MIKGKYIVRSNGKIIAEKDNLITTNGFYMINRNLAKSNVDWAGSLTIGAMSVAPSISDKELYYEIDRMPVTLKSYIKMSPRYVILNKKLTSNVAYINFKSTTTPILANLYKVQITGVDATFNGTYNITSFGALQTNSITGATSSYALVTYTAPNQFVVGETVSVTGVNPTTYNITGTVTSASSTSFTILNPAGVVSYGAYSNGGTAVQNSTYQIQYSKTASDVASTAVSSNSALVSVLTDNLGNSIYNNEIVLKATLDPALSARIYEVGVLPINLKKQVGISAIKNLTSFSEISTSDSSLSQWTSSLSSSQTSLIGLTNINGSSTAQQSGYTWYNGSYNVTINVSNTSGLKVGSSVYISGTTAATGSTLAPSGSGSITQINGNYQVTVLMGSSNTTGSTQYGYGGTLSLNSTSQGVASTHGGFNVQLNAGDTLTLNNVVLDATAFSSSDSLLLLYYNPGGQTITNITVGLTDNNNSNSPFTAYVTPLITSVGGLNVARIQLPSTFPSTGITINQISVGMTGSVGAYIYLDSLKLVTNDYWTAHPYAGTLQITSVAPSTPSSGFITFTTNGSHNYAAGNTVTISNVTGYNGTYTIYSITSRNTFVVQSSTTGAVTPTTQSQSLSTTTVIMPPEYQLTSRSLFTNPIIKNTGQQMDIEYHLQVT